MIIHQREDISRLLESLGIDVDSYEETVKAYLNLLFLNEFLKKDSNVDRAKEGTIKMLCLYRIPFFSCWDDSVVTELIALMNQVQAFSWKSFFITYAPGLIMDMEAIELCKGGVVDKLAAIYHLLDLFKSGDEISDTDFRKMYQDNIQRGFTEEEFVALGNAVFLRKIKPAILRVNPQVEEVCKTYDSMHISRNALLDNINISKSAKSREVKPQHQWADYSKARLKKIHSGKNKDYEYEADRYPLREGGETEEQFLYINGASQLKNIEATDIVNSLFYNAKRNDYAFERDILLERFFSQVKTTDTVLIVNPCPSMVKDIESDRKKAKYKNLYFLVNDDVLKNLYNKQFQNGCYYAFHDEGVPQADKVLIIARDYPRKNIFDLFVVVSQMKKVPWITAFMYNAAFPELETHIGNKLHPIRIVKVATDLVGSIPKEKTIIEYEPVDDGAEHNENDSLIILNEIMSIRTDGGRYYYFNKFNRRISNSQYNKSFTELLSLENKTLYPPKPVTITRIENPSETFGFSKEIQLNYVMLSRKNTVAAKAYYRSIKKEGRAKYGKRLTPNTEKGLRANTKEQLMQKLEELPYSDEFYPAIYLDIKENLVENNVNVSLKTIWFMLHEILQKTKGYKEELSVDIFTSKCQELSDINPYISDAEDYQIKLDYVFYDKSEEEKGNYLKQLSVILSCAIRNGYKIGNPIAELLMQQVDKVQKEQKNARNRLLKRVLTEREIRALLSYICGTVNHIDSEIIRRYQTDSVALAAGIRLFTGMATKEICSLSWEDIIKIKALDFEEILISKFINEEGEIETNIEAEDWLKYRRIPLMKVVSYMLAQRKSYLKRKYHLLESEIAKHPIINMTDKDYEDKTKAIPDRCSLSKLTEGFRKVMNMAEIKEKTIVFPDAENESITDLSKNPNIYYSNFKHQANHVAMLTHGEINYVLGISPPTTFDKHYCDYTNDFIQFRIFSKLNRWGNRYADIIEGREQSSLSYGAINGSMIESRPDYDKKSMLDIIIEDTDAEYITIDSEHGYNFTITDYGLSEKE